MRWVASTDTSDVAVRTRTPKRRAAARSAGSARGSSTRRGDSTASSTRIASRTPVRRQWSAATNSGLSPTGKHGTCRSEIANTTVPEVSDDSSSHVFGARSGR